VNSCVDRREGHRRQEREVVTDSTHFGRASNNASHALLEIIYERKEMSKRRVLVTGASKGIGRAVAHRLAAEGYDLIGIARTAPSDFPGRFHEVDLGDEAAAGRTFDKIVAEGRVDAVVNNFGFWRLACIGSVAPDDLLTVYDMNVRPTVQGVQAVLPGMVEAGWGRIVNVTSSSTLGAAETTPYAAAKAALETCTRIWAGELASTGITVNSVAPGPIATEMLRETTPVGSEREARLLDDIPLRRLGAPAEVAHVISMLLHEDAGYITGQIVRVDGGGSIAGAHARPEPSPRARSGNSRRPALAVQGDTPPHKSGHVSSRSRTRRGRTPTRFGSR
jgi:3-oxoacyl-[acyl-carrier protein] reductase